MALRLRAVPLRAASRNAMTSEAVKWMAKIENTAKPILEQAGLQWDNRNPVYREAYAAFEARDVGTLKQIWKDNFC